VARHIDFLGVLYLIWGGLSALLGFAMFALAGGAAMIMTTGDEGARVPAGLTAATFSVIGLIALAWGGGNAITGRALRHRRTWSRVTALTLGVVNLLILPFGTALGVYTLWVLLHEDASG
jgi:hypothetical protein